MKSHRAASRIAAILFLLCPALAAQRWNAPRIVTWNCSGCHGIDGNSEPTYFPRLAGLNADYAERRIAEFRASPQPPADELFVRMVALLPGKAGASKRAALINMVGPAHAMTAEDGKLSAAWYAKQKPGQGRSGKQSLIERGKELYLAGSKPSGLLACQTCHGAEAAGMGNTPRLAGQNAGYLIAEMEKFNGGDRQHAPEMTAVAQHGNSEQFRALAAYLQSR